MDFPGNSLGKQKVKIQGRCKTIDIEPIKNRSNTERAQGRAQAGPGSKLGRAQARAHKYSASEPFTLERFVRKVHFF